MSEPQHRDELSRADRRREEAERVRDDAPREGVAIFRTVERAILVGLRCPDQTDEEIEASLHELELLVNTAGGVAVGRLVQRRPTPDPATFIGSGKLAELRAQVGALSADAVIFDDELTPAQQRNLEQRLNAKVLDRTIVILDIFAQHAASREGKLQVELAQLTYLLPRLRGWGTTLSRQAGGIGTRLRGPGETQLEVDRRKLSRRITKLKAELQDSERTRTLKARNRARNGIPTVALVGYTNAGKSTLLNRLTGAEAHVADQLFATLDVTARRLALPDGRKAVVTDTVGFVQKLPTQLVEAFKSTLEQTLEADLVLHVSDASRPDAEEQMQAVDRVLAEIGGADLPRLLVLNKVDVADPRDVERLQRRHADTVAVSAHTGQGCDRLREVIGCWLPHERRIVEALVPYDRGELVALAHREGEILKEEHRADGTYLVASLGRRSAAPLEPYALVSGWEPAPVPNP